MKENTLCFTGHRPEKLPVSDMDNDEIIIRIKKRLKQEILKSIQDGYTNFITGVARGVDLWAGSIVASLKHDYPQIKLICAVPYRNFGKNFKGKDKWDLAFIMDCASEIHYMSETYNPHCLKDRNEYMVDNSSRIIAVIKDYKSGTGQTIRYAQKSGTDIILIDVNYPFF